MASFPGKIGWKRQRKRENKNYRSILFLPDVEQKIPKKIAKKFKKLINIVMASFQAKIGWKWMRKSESKNYRSVPFLPEAEQKIPKKQQKNSKN